MKNKTKKVKVRAKKKYIRTTEKVVKVDYRPRINIRALVFWVVHNNLSKWCTVDFIRNEIAKDGINLTSIQVSIACHSLAGLAGTLSGSKPRNEFITRFVSGDFSVREYKFNPHGTIRVRSTKNVLGTVSFHKTKKAVLVQRSFQS